MSFIHALQKVNCDLSELIDAIALASDLPKTSVSHAVNAALEAITKALKGHREDKQAAARVLGIALSTLYAKLKKYQL